MSFGYADHEPNARLKGITLIVAAFTLFAMLDACAKYLTGWHAVAQVVFARYAVHLVIAVLVTVPARGWQVWKSNNVGLQILRSALLLGATTLNFVALQYLQLAETAAIAFTIPLWVALLSVPLLGEHIGIHRWVAVLAGFVGVLIIVQPGTGLLHWAAFLSMAMAVCVALYQITTRMLAGVDSSATTLLFTAAVGTLGLLPFALQSWSVPTSATIGPMLAIGAIGAIGHQFLITAHRWAPAPVLAPFGYVQIIPMTALGFWVFGDIPGESTLFGGLVVVGSGLYLLHRERIRQPARLQKPAEPRV